MHLALLVWTLGQWVLFLFIVRVALGIWDQRQPYIFSAYGRTIQIVKGSCNFELILRVLRVALRLQLGLLDSYLVVIGEILRQLMCH